MECGHGLSVRSRRLLAARFVAAKNANRHVGVKHVGKIVAKTQRAAQR
jgi:hypothetical protein